MRPGGQRFSILWTKNRYGGLCRPESAGVSLRSLTTLIEASLELLVLPLPHSMAGSHKVVDILYSSRGRVPYWNGVFDDFGRCILEGKATEAIPTRICLPHSSLSTSCFRSSKEKGSCRTPGVSRYKTRIGNSFC